ncbi:MAG: ferredoxin--nitrite reductase [Chloroflexi bacterium]|nr:ferredoxin--nitrite reductase [Chloroflexota bacterium]
MNKFEEIKAERDGLDVLPDILRYAQSGWESITDDDKVRLKWYGLFYRKHTPGHFMLRLRIPNGIATSNQMRVLAGIAREFGREELDVTTRQQIQLRWFRIEDVPEIFARLADAGLEHRQTGMDNIRGVMGCALAGMTLQEVIDASPIVRSLSRRLSGDRAFSNLPRKFNISITGCTENCVPAASQDLALVPAVREALHGTQVGFNVLVGGKMGSGGFTPARSLNVFVRPEDAEELCVQMIFLFRDHGSRETRAKARLAFLVEAWGLERLRAELEQRLGRCLEPAGHDLRRTYESDHIGVVQLRQQDRYAVGLAVPVGRLRAAQVEQASDLADAYGDGTVRLTSGQNLLFSGIAGGRLSSLLSEPLLQTLRHDPAPAVRGTIACTGIGLCDLALTDTKNDALAIARQLAQQLPPCHRPLSINWSGCPAGCGNHHAADIGLQGGKARIGDTVQEVYQVFVGGRAGVHARPAQPLVAQVPADQIGSVVARLAEAHAAGADLLEVGASVLGLESETKTAEQAA